MGRWGDEGDEEVIFLCPMPHDATKFRRKATGTQWLPHAPCPMPHAPCPNTATSNREFLVDPRRVWLCSACVQSTYLPIAA